MCVQCGVCVCFVRGGVWCVVCVCWCVRCGACAEKAWDVRFVFWCCGVLCCVVMCRVGAGVGVQCVVCGVCGVCGVVCVLCVARLGTRKKPVCRFKTSPCVDALMIKRLAISSPSSNTSGWGTTSPSSISSPKTFIHWEKTRVAGRMPNLPAFWFSAWATP